jgi:hypothetical protein
MIYDRSTYTVLSIQIVAFRVVTSCNIDVSEKPVSIFKVEVIKLYNLVTFLAY